MAQPAAAAAAPAQEGSNSGFSVHGIAKAVAIYAVISWAAAPTGPIRSKFFPQSVPATAVAPLSSEGLTAEPVQAQAAGQKVEGQTVPQLEVLPLWPEGSIIDMVLKLSTKEDGSFQAEDGLPSVAWKGLDWSTSNWTKEWEIEWDVPASVQKNASLWADLYINLEGATPETDPENTLLVRKLLTRYMPKVKVRAVKNLLKAKDESDEERSVREKAEEIADKEIMPIISYYHSNVTFEMVPQTAQLSHSTLPEALSQWIKIAHPEKRDAEGKGFYFPITWANDFWLLREHMNPINETTTTLPLHVTIKPSSFWKFQIMASMDDSFAKQSAQTGNAGDLDVLKRMLTDTNPILLITTAIVSVLHMVFEMLAFTSDIKHWRNQKGLVGVSVRTILTNVFVQLIVLLYLVDNNENTSWMILGSQAMGLVIEAWKINKAVDVAIERSPASMLGYKLKITDKHVLSAEELKTQEYDQLAFKWVSWGTAPALVGYTIYSLMYNEHRGWYSFTISTLTSFVYMFGFVQLIPQLIINWKLKSVAHMPMMTMAYKFMATIVDDFFSFVVKMPFLHRLACFRDDIVFCCLLAQYWMYRVDPTRANEYGQQLTEEEAAKFLAAQKEGKGVPAVEEKKESVKKGKKETKKTQ